MVKIYEKGDPAPAAMRALHYASDLYFHLSCVPRKPGAMLEYFRRRFPEEAEALKHLKSDDVKNDVWTLDSYYR